VNWGFEANNVVPFEDLEYSDLIVDKVYAAGPLPDLRSEVLSRLLPVGNVGGFRWSGKWDNTNLVVLTSNGNEALWPDRFDRENRIVEYFGDNRSFKELHDTRGGNRILHAAFQHARGGSVERSSAPVFLYFEKSGSGRDWKFSGVLVPGRYGQEIDQSLRKVWSESSEGKFANYLATFTALDIPRVSRGWLDDILRGIKISEQTPHAFRNWIDTGDLSSSVS